MSDVSNWPQLIKTDANSNHYLAVTGKKKFQLISLFPSVSTVGAGVAPYSAITNKNQFNLRALASTHSAITVATGSGGQIDFGFVPGSVDLSLCDNSTSQFLTSIDVSSVTGTLGVLNGGTGLATIPQGSLLFASALNTLSASTAMNVNGMIPIGNNSTGVPSFSTLTAGANVTITNTPGAISIAANLSVLASNLDTGAFGINLNAAAGPSWISGNGTDMGITVNASGRVFIGDNLPTIPALSAQLTLGGDATTALSLGNPNNYKNQFISVKSPSAAVNGADLTLIAGTGFLNMNGGNIIMRAGAGTGTGTSGDAIIDAGVGNGPIIGGNVRLRFYKGGLPVDGLVVDNTGGVSVPSGAFHESQTAQSLIGAGVVDVLSAKCHFTDTGANALTLADGIEGQHKYIMQIATSGGSGTLTPTNLAGGTTITFNAVGDTVHLMFTNGSWFVVGQNGVVIA